MVGGETITGRESVNLETLNLRVAAKLKKLVYLVLEIVEAGPRYTTINRSERADEKRGRGSSNGSVQRDTRYSRGEPARFIAPPLANDALFRREGQRSRPINIKDNWFQRGPRFRIHDLLVDNGDHRTARSLVRLNYLWSPKKYSAYIRTR